MTVPGRRSERLGKQIRQEVSELVAGELKDPRIGFATITDVRLSPDLRHASVYVSVLGSAAQQQETLAGFRAATAFIRRELARRLNLRRMPELSFALDHSAEYGAHIEELLRQAREASEGKKHE